MRRGSRGQYRGRVLPVEVPVDGTRRERVMTTMHHLAAAFEELIADAPDQWWAVFFPIWPDLEAAAAVEAGDGAEAGGTTDPAASDSTGAAA